MYAVIEDSGRQFRVQPHDTIEVDARELPEGNNQIVFDKILLVGQPGETAQIGQPWVDGATVTGHVEKELKGPKIHVVKFKRRKGYRRTQGHRQQHLRVKIDAINA